MNTQTEVLSGIRLIEVAARCARDTKAEALMILDLSGFSGAADWFVVCNGDNSLHNKAIAQAVSEGLRQVGTKPWHIEGFEQGRWILLDYTDVVVHIMLPDLRSYYQLEHLWENIPTATITDERSLRDAFPRSRS